MALFKKANYTIVTPPQKKEIPIGLWIKCKGCSQVIYRTKLEENLQVCPQCGFHYPMTIDERLAQLVDKDSFQEVDADLTSIDSLNFAGTGVYPEKLAKDQKKTGLKDAIVCGAGKLDGSALATYLK